MIPFVIDRKFFEGVITGCIICVAIVAFFILRYLAMKFQKDDEATKQDVVNHMDLIKNRFYDN